MTLSPGSHPRTATSPTFELRPYWRIPARTPLRGLSVVREGNYLFTWDQSNTLQLLNSLGSIQSRISIPGKVVAVAAADSGRCYAAVTRDGNLFVLNADLSIQKQGYLRTGVASLALDPHGNYLLFSDLDGILGMADLEGKTAWLEKAVCSFVYLTFMPILPFVVGGSRLGLVTCYDFNGNCVWTNGPVSHVGGLAVRGADGLCVLACFSEGLRHYSYAGKDLGRRRLLEPCRIVAVPFASELFLTAGFSSRLSLVDESGMLLAQTSLEESPAHLALSAAADQAFVTFQSGEMASFEIVRPLSG